MPRRRGHTEPYYRRLREVRKSLSFGAHFRLGRRRVSSSNRDSIADVGSRIVRTRTTNSRYDRHSGSVARHLSQHSRCRRSVRCRLLFFTRVPMTFTGTLVSRTAVVFHTTAAFPEREGRSIIAHKVLRTFRTPFACLCIVLCCT